MKDRRPQGTSMRFGLLFLLVIFVFGNVPHTAAQNSSVETLRQTGKTFSQIAERAAASVVGIQAARTVPEGRGFSEMPFDEFGGDNFFEWFFRNRPDQSPRRQQQMAQGSGFLISSDGYILTNYHLIGDSTRVSVQMPDETRRDAIIIGMDPETDIALIKIDVENVPYLELADSDAIEVGEWVLAVGNPFGLSHSVTAGIVSAKGRTGVGVAAYEDFIQTDAAVNPGNSGGPLLNLDGQVVGLNTAIISRTGGSMGIGLAIPSNMIRQIYNELLLEGEVIRGYLGVAIQDLTPELARAFGTDATEGVVIADVTEGFSADQAGIRRGDIIIELDGEPVENADALRNRVARQRPRTQSELVIIRDGQRQAIDVTVGRRPTERRPEPQPNGDQEPRRNIGISVQNMTEELARRLGMGDSRGVLVNQVQPGSLAADAGLEPGMLISEVNRSQVRNTREFVNAINRARDSGMILLWVNTGEISQYITIEMPTANGN